MTSRAVEKWEKNLEKRKKTGEKGREKVYGAGGVEKMERETVGNVEMMLKEVEALWEGSLSLEISRAKKFHPE